ncbi:MBL fold metallo-hydrolase [Halanaerobium salsuginis]|jgi:glyoxylase-like metal-dependent hydrolase (beta-lactamase superfamily II)|uniref:Glyoxylase, beta-lactamase superfamily II n=1 Tax=Halanaerobium salsuginis TaxID=29563 RepID=A0A1I4GCG9_9FIRM|nr:MBL fold metallo-hydrolase [Halanaerobium salsuginis]SFL26861.1 Glyoxylase, beta-lactamase superfamily II [Halanaerobium salsuginis]
MKINHFTVGQLATRSYLISENGKAMLIDPGAEGAKLLEFIRANNLKLEYIVITHGHFDHIGANAYLKEKTGAAILAHPKAKLKFNDSEKNLSKIFLGQTITSPGPDAFLDEGDRFDFESLQFDILATPGHSEDSISLFEPVEQKLFSGDCIFAGGVGRTDLADSSYTELKTSINEKLLKLDPVVEFFPGHGPRDTIKNFKKNTWPFIA